MDGGTETCSVALFELFLAGREVDIGLEGSRVLELLLGHVHGIHRLFGVQGNVYDGYLHRIRLIISPSR